MNAHILKRYFLLSMVKKGKNHGTRIIYILWWFLDPTPLSFQLPFKNHDLKIELFQ